MKNNITLLLLVHQSSLNEVDNNNILFILDSGTTDHLIKSDKFLKGIKNIDIPYEVAVAEDGASIEVVSGGYLPVYCNVDGKKLDLTLNQVCVAPKIRHNLLSVRKIDGKGGEVTFKEGKAYIKINNKVIIEGYLKDGLYWVKFEIRNIASNVIENNFETSLLWHRRLGHLGMQNVIKLFNENMVLGVKPKKEEIDFCEPCIRAKQTKLQFQGNRPKTNHPLERIHSDVCGPMSEPSIYGDLYFVTFLDDFTHLTITYLIKQTSEVFIKFKEYYEMACAHFQKKNQKI